MRTVFRVAWALAIIFASLEAKAAGRAFAPDGLSTLKSEYRIPGGRPLLFCGEKFMVVLIVGFVYQEKGTVIPVAHQRCRLSAKTTSREFNSIWNVEPAFSSEKQIGGQSTRGPMLAPSWNVWIS